MPGSARSAEPFQSAARNLEEAFFLEQDKVLIERLRAMKKMAETKEALREVSGISNDAVLSRLVELEIHPEIVAALAAIPLVEVAWADAQVDPKERQTILAHVGAQGIAPGSVEHALLERWLTHRPEPKLLAAWQTYIRGLCENLSAEERALLKKELLDATRAVAQAAGGFLGLGKISSSEQRVLDTLAAAFEG